MRMLSGLGPLPLMGQGTPSTDRESLLRTAVLIDSSLKETQRDLPGMKYIDTTSPTLKVEQIFSEHS